MQTTFYSLSVKTDEKIDATYGHVMNMKPEPQARKLGSVQSNTKKNLGSLPAALKLSHISYHVFLTSTKTEP